MSPRAARTAPSSASSPRSVQRLLRLGAQALCLASLGPLAGEAHAAPPPLSQAEAADLFSNASAAFRKQQFVLAATLFELLHRSAPAAEAVFNAGLAWDAAGKPHKAADAFAHALVDAGELNADHRTEAGKRLAQHRGRFGWLLLQGEAQVAVDGAEPEPLPRTVHLDPGEHSLRVSWADGTSETRTVVVQAGAESSLRLVREARAAGPSAPGPKGFGAQHWAGIGLGGGGLLLGLVGIGTGVAALDARDRFYASGFVDANARGAADQLRATTTVLWAVGAASLVAGGFVYLTAPSPGPGAKPACAWLIPAVGPGFASLSLAGTF
jgi:hypothetical protein